MTRAARLGEMTYAALAALLRDEAPVAALVPAGATEAHGPHLPLGTDTILAEGLAVEAARQLAGRGVSAVVFPPVAYTVTTWAAGFPGTVGTEPEALRRTLTAVLERALDMGFAVAALVNAHLEPANVAVLRGVVEDLARHRGRPVVFADQTRRRYAERLTEEFRSGSCHAGRYETSLVLALAPELVDERVRAGLDAHHVPLHEHIAQGATSFADCGLDRAYCGDPAAATAGEGRAVLARQAAMTVEAVLARLGDEAPRPPDGGAAPPPPERD